MRLAGLHVARVLVVVMLIVDVEVVVLERLVDMRVPVPLAHQ